MVKRLANPSKSRSFFLFGARGTGKSTFVRDQFLKDNGVILDLLDPEIEERLSRNPTDLVEIVDGFNHPVEWIVIDEVQKVPKLLNLVHKLIEERKQKFILTSSSARKLKRGGANLLAGRAFLNTLYPFTESELEKKFNLNEILRWGSLPEIFHLNTPSDRSNYLKTYTRAYLKEEIKEEQLVRKIEPFREFLDVAAQLNGTILNNSKIAMDVGVDHKTVASYYQILVDTWIGFYLPAFHHSVRKGQRMSPKFYFFDIGVKNALAGLLRSVPTPGNSLYGQLFEHYLILEIYRYNEYLQKDFRLSYLSTSNNTEVDLILTRNRENYVIEIKSKDRADKTEIKKLERIATDIKNLKSVLYVSNDKQRLKSGSVTCIHWRDFLDWFRNI